MALKVAQVALSLEVGGLEVLVYHLAKRLKAQGHDCTIFCLDTLGSLGERALGEGIDVQCIGRRGGVLDLATIRHLRRLIRAGGYSVVHTHNMEAMFYGALAALFAGPSGVIHSQHGLPSPFAAANRLKGRLAAGCVDRFVTVSQDVNRFVTDHHLVRPGKTLTILNGIDTDHFTPDPEAHREIRTRLAIGDSDPVLICVARLSEIKNHLRLVTQFVELAKRQPRCRLLLVGDGPMRDSIESAIQSAGLHDRIVLCGEQMEIAAYLAAADLFVLTSDSEGISVSILEAMSCGLPPVVSCVGGNREIVHDGENGYCIPLERIEQLPTLVDDLLSDTSRMQSMSRKARDTVVEGFSISAMVDSYLAEYQGLVTGRD